MKLKHLLEHKGLLQAQQHLLELLDDSAWDVSIEHGELRLAHPKILGNATFGPMEYSDLEGETGPELIENALEYYRENGMKPLWAQCQNIRRANMLVCFATLNEAIDAALSYNGACFDDLDQAPIAQELAMYLNDGIIAASELENHG